MNTPDEVDKEFRRTFGSESTQAAPFCRVWNDTALAQCGRYHEAMARNQRFAAQLIFSDQSRALIERDAEMHERFATACYEAQ